MAGGRCEALLVRCQWGWDVEAPRRLASQLWLRLVVAGASAAGTEDEARAHTALGLSSFPADFPATRAHAAYWAERRAALAAERRRRPTSKQGPSPWPLGASVLLGGALVRCAVTLCRQQPLGARAWLEEDAALFLPLEADKAAIRSQRGAWTGVPVALTDARKPLAPPEPGHGQEQEKEQGQEPRSMMEEVEVEEGKNDYGDGDGDDGGDDDDGDNGVEGEGSDKGEDGVEDEDGQQRELLGGVSSALGRVLVRPGSVAAGTAASGIALVKASLVGELRGKAQLLVLVRNRCALDTLAVAHLRRL